MFKKWVIIVWMLLSAFSIEKVAAALHPKKAKTSQHKKTSPKNTKKHSKNKHLKKRKKTHPIKETVADKTKRAASQALIASNQEKIRISDSTHKLVFAQVNKEDEGYFANLFSKQKLSNQFQTIEGTAAVFKSVSGWEDKKFYILTNELPVGTLVRVTTPDFKSICAKVISTLPDVSSTIQYRLNDAAAAILGITKKTFSISVTY